MDDCFALVRRADTHLKALDRLFETFLARRPYRVDPHVDATPAEEALIEARAQGGWRATLAGPTAPREIVLIGRVIREPPAQRAGLLIADAVNNLRAALDHQVWALSIKAGPPPNPIPRGGQWRKVGWPIVSNPTAWAPTAAMRLGFIDRGIWPEFERLQPFRRLPQEPERDEFSILDELWNVYKHRHLPLTQVWIGLEKAVSLLNRVQVFDAPPGHADGLRKQLHEHAYVVDVGGAPRPFVDGAELGRIREAQPPYSWWPEAHVDAHLAVDIAFDQGPPAYGAPVRETLRRIRDEVVAGLEALEPFT
jgi:hypothetical protein